MLAAARREEREYASREMRRQTELRDEMRNSVEAMETMIASQQRIDELTRSLNELRDLHRRMLEAGIGQESESEDEDPEEEESNEDDDRNDSLHDDIVDGGVFHLDEDDGICNKEGSNPISSSIVSSPRSTRKHDHT